MDPAKPGNSYTTTCPFVYVQGCKWKNFVSGIVDHFICSHKSSYKSHPITAELYRGTVYQYLTVVFNTVFYVQVKVNEHQHIECLVKYLYQHQKDTLEYYEHQFAGGIDSFGEPHQSEKFVFTIQVIPNQQNTETVSYKIEISITTTNGLAVQDAECVSLNLKKQFKKADDLMPETFSSITLENSELEATTTRTFLEELVCPACANYLIAPIFNCTTGHSICKDCKPKLKVCPTCKSKVTNARSYLLEKLIERLEYPCKYAQFGCQQTLQWKNISEHFDHCFYKTLKCPFSSCGININFSAITDHFEREHLIICFKQDQVLTIVISTSNESFNSTIFENEVFLLGFQYVSVTNYMQFACIRLTTGDVKNRKYAFDLRFVSDTDSNQKFTLSDNCKEEYADFVNNRVSIPVQVVKDCISNKSESSLYFKCLIRKV